MFTIKHIDEDGHEMLWNTEKPCFQSGTFLSETNGSTSWVKGGTVYVMNDKGSTVATYKLESVREGNQAASSQHAAQRAALLARYQQNYDADNIENIENKWREAQVAGAPSAAMQSARTGFNTNSGVRYSNQAKGMNLGYQNPMDSQE